MDQAKRLDWALMALRLSAGAVFFGQGCAKLFGWFGGAGYAGQAKVFESYCQAGVCLSPGMPFAIWIGTWELIGGLCLLLGLFTPVIGLLFILEMTTAMIFRSSKLGFWGVYGMSSNLLLIMCAFSVLLLGAGRFSLPAMFKRGGEQGGAAQPVT